MIDFSFHPNPPISPFAHHLVCSHLELTEATPQEFFKAQLEEARAVVQEPPQPKIKLKLQSSMDTPTPTTGKRITIHVGGRGNSTENGTPLNGIDTKYSGTPARSTILEKTRSASAAVASPSPSTAMDEKMEDREGSTSGIRTRGASAVHNSDIPAADTVMQNGIPAVVEPPQPPQPVGPIMWDKMFRQPGKSKRPVIPKQRSYYP